MGDFLMPKLGADMTEGRLVAWRKAAGATIHRGDILADVDTDKGVIEVESFSDGVLESLVANPGDFVPVGSVLAHIRVAETAPEASSSSAVSPAEKSPIASSLPAPDVLAAPVPRETMTDIPSSFANAEKSRARVSPSARNLAIELNVDLNTVTGSGPGLTKIVLRCF